MKVEIRPRQGGISQPLMAGLSLLWGLSLWIGLSHRIGRPGAWFEDYRALTCAASQTLAGHSPYGSPACPGASAFVYPPWIADAASLALRLMGDGGLTVVYSLAFCAALALIGWAVFILPVDREPIDRRLVFLSFVSGGPVAYGNIAVILHALLLAAGLFVGPDSILFALVLGLAGMVKPQLLALSLVIVCSTASVRRKAALIALAALGPVVLLLSPYPGLVEWKATAFGAVMANDPGGGFFTWMGALGLHALVLQAPLYAIYVAVLWGCAFAICTAAKLASPLRFWIALTVGVLTMPRVMSYDLLVIGPGCIALQVAAACLGERERTVGNAWYVAGGVSLVGATLGGLAKILLQARLWVICAVVLVLGWRALGLIRRERVAGGPARALGEMKPS